MNPAYHLAISQLAAAVCGCALLKGYRRVAGTTLHACWWWCLASLVALALGSLALWGPLAGSDAWQSHARHAAGISTFCPLMALLGAKRPQDRAWQFIVLSLAGVLLLPSLTSLVDRPDAVLSLHGARQWFLAILIALGLFNGVATRFWPSSVLATAAQVVVLAPYLPWLEAAGESGMLAGHSAYSAGMACLAVAALLRAAGLPRRVRAEEPLDRLWLDFRDSYGAVWGLRVAERMSATGRIAGWPWRLGWNGFYAVDEAERTTPLSPETRLGMVRSLRALLRRFVSSGWITERLEPATRNEKAPA